MGTQTFRAYKIEYEDKIIDYIEKFKVKSIEPDLKVLLDFVFENWD